MATCNATTLLASGKTFASLSPHALQAVIASLLCQILQAQNSMASCDPTTLLASAKCFMCLDSQALMALQAQLLCEVLDVGTGSGQVLIDYAPATAPPNPNKPAVSYPTGGGAESQWDVASQTWK